MSQDPFERFERSRGGFLIPVLVFMLGAVPTMFAIRTMNHLAVLEDAPVEAVPAAGDEAAIKDNHPARPAINRDNEETSQL